AAFGGQHHDANILPCRIAAYFLAHRESIPSRNHDIQQHEIGRLLRDCRQGRLAVRYGAHAKSRLLEQKLKREHDIWLVIGNKDRSVHGDTHVAQSGGQRTPLILKPTDGSTLTQIKRRFASLADLPPANALTSGEEQWRKELQSQASSQKCHHISGIQARK